MTRSEIVKNSLVSERNVVNWLRLKGFPDARSMNYDSHYDIYVNDKRVEVKVAKAQKDRQNHSVWRFNIHRHGVLKETGVDAYILRLEDVPEFTYAIHLILPAPLGVMSVSITMRNLITRYAKYFENFVAIGGVQPVEEIIADTEEIV